MKERATILINAEVASAREEIGDLDGDLTEVTVSAERADRAVSGIGGPEDVARLQVLQNRVSELEDELSAAGRSASATRGDVRVLLDEVGAAGNIFRNMSGSAKALTGALVGGVATAAAGATLAGAATVIASKYGSAGLQAEVKGLRGEFQFTARVISDEFSEVIRQDALPTARNLLQVIRDMSDELASFTSSTFAAGRSLENAGSGQGSIFNTLGAQFVQGGLPRLLQQQVTGDIPFVPNRGFVGLLTGAVPTSGTEQSSASERISNVVSAVETARSQLQSRTSTMSLFGVGREAVLQQRIGKLEKLRQKLIKTRSATDLQDAPQSWFKLDATIRDVQGSIEDYRTQLKAAKDTTPVEQQQTAADNLLEKFQRLTTQRGQQVTEAKAQQRALKDLIRLQQRLNRAQAVGFGQTARNPQQAAPAGRTSLRTGSVGGTLDGFQLSGSARELGRVGQAAQNAGDDVEQSVNRELQRGVNLASQIGTTLIRSAREGGVEFEQVFGTILSAVGGTLSAIPGVGNIAGPILGGAGRLISAFDRGGVVDTPLQVVGESGPELAALPQGTRVSTARETERMLAGAQSVNVNIETELRRLPNGDLGVAVRESQRRKARHE